MEKETTKKKRGHETTYTDAYNKKAKEYLQNSVDVVTEFHKTRGEKSDSYERIIDVKIPSVAGLAIYLKVARSTIYKWADEQPNFSDTLEQILATQEEILTSNGLGGQYSPVITKLMLSNNHGYKEKTETDVTSKGERISGFNYIDPTKK